jgi:thioredoxin-like negative regulator of GroEL
MHQRHQRYRSLIAFAAALVFSAAASAAGVPFESKAFAADQSVGKPILVAVHADWCPTCRAQDPVVDELLRAPKYRGFTAYRVDFDKQKSVVKGLRAQYQSTLIVFKGAKEVARSTAQVDPDAIAAQLDKAL